MINLNAQQNNSVQDFFFRTADRMRVEGCANAIAHEGLSLVLYSAHEPLLDHYLALLLERLRRQTPEPRIEVYFPTNTESLIARFNDVLTQQSVQEATRQPQETNSPQIWIVHDTQQLPDQEIQLMARLIQNFPGANIRAILLMTGNNPQKASLSALGRKVLRWDIELPSPEQAQLALEQATHDGQLQAVSQLLRRIGCMPTSAVDVRVDVGDEIPSLALAAAVSSPGRPLNFPVLGLLRRLRQLPQSALALWGKSPSLSRFAALPKWPPRWAIAAGIALLLSIGIMAWIQPHAFGDADKSKTKLQPTAPSAPATASPVAATRASQEPAAEVPDESQQSQAWVRSLPAGSFLIQHGSVDTYEKAVEVKKSVPTQGHAKIVAAYRPGEALAHFVIVSGPFENLGKAYESMNRREATRSSWVRATGTLQVQLNGPNGPKEIRP